jgi:hypothetical protein
MLTAPQIGDPTAAGNTCNDETDPIGCIISQNLLTPVVSEAEIQAAVADVAVAGGAGAGAAVAGGAAVADAAACVAQGAATAGAATGAAAGNAGAATATVATGTVNVQSFTGALGGVPAPPVESTAGAARPFEVNGATFLNAGAALQRSCAVQKNACANAANSGQLAGGAQQCDAQEDECRGAAALRRRARRTMA